MKRYQTGEFTCIDAHTCGNPVRVLVKGAPELNGETMLERRAHFQSEFDWIRTGLMYEPRGHEVMSGSILYETTRPDCDIGILFIEVSGCLPMCGHGTIGTATVAIERGLVKPRNPGIIRFDAPAGVVEASYKKDKDRVSSVRITNVASYLAAENIYVDLPEIGHLKMDVAYGGNFYAIVDSQENFRDLEDLSPGDIQRLSPVIRKLINESNHFVHPEKSEISGVSHIMWTGAPKSPEADARNAVFYGDRAIDRSPCGTGTSARMAQWAARGDLKQGDDFVHESIIGSLFHGRIEAVSTVGENHAILPSIEGWARIYGDNVITISEDDPMMHGFLLS